MAPVRVAIKTPTRFGLHRVVLIGDRGDHQKVAPLGARPRTAATSGSESTRPIPVNDPWDAFADDQLRLMDHLGIRKFFFVGNCIGGSFALKLMERAPDRVVAWIVSRQIGHRPESPNVMYDLSLDI